MHLSNFQLSLALLVASVAPCNASAQSAADSTARATLNKATFERLDANSDGRLSRVEAGDQSFFQAADANDNGFVTQREAVRYVQSLRDGSAQAAEPSEPVFPADPAAVEKRGAILSQIGSVTDGDQRPPNIVLLFADDLGYGDTSTYGSKQIPTPHLDRLASQGVQLSNAYVTAASCSPSRAGLMSGCYQQRYGFEFNTSGGAITHRLHRGLSPTAITMADVMKAAGYRTGMFGKWHLGTRPQFHPQARGFDEFYGFLAGAHSFLQPDRVEPFHSTVMRGQEPLNEPDYLTDALARETSRFIDAHSDKPFFAYVPFNAVHTPLEATDKYLDRFPDITDPKRKAYYGMTSALDDAVGTIVDALARNGVTDNTLVIFLNDNGGPLYTGVQSNGPLKLGKLFLFEGGIRVPMILRWPHNIAAGSTFDGTTSSLDVFPTVCAAAGIDLPAEVELDGVNLLPFLTGSLKGSPHDTLYWSNGPNKAVRHNNWKYIRSHESTWLYDLSVDIGESNDLSESRPDKLQELEALLDAWQQSVATPAWPSKPNRRKVPVDGGIYEMNI